MWIKKSSSEMTCIRNRITLPIDYEDLKDIKALDVDIKKQSDLCLFNRLFAQHSFTWYSERLLNIKMYVYAKILETPHNVL